MNDKLAELLRKKENITFLVGNGFNRYVQSTPSWADVIKYVAKKALNDENVYKSLNNFVFSSGMSYPEMFSIIESKYLTNKKDQGVCNNDCFHESLRNLIADFLKKNQQLSCGFIDYIKDSKANIITTNFDFGIEKALGINHPKINRANGSGNRSPRYSYLFHYFGENNSYKVWHIHGHCLNRGSLRLSLSDYTLTLDYIKKNLFVDNDGNHVSPRESFGWVGATSCVGPFFKKNILIIIGCGLDSQEVLLRELLIYKSRGWERRLGLMGYYLCTQKEADEEKGKMNFFKSLNIEVVTFDDYSDIYNSDIWNRDVSK